MTGPALPLVQKEATISACGRYRTRLTRRWGDGPLLPFVMLNPSTADAEVDDATIRRCMGFAQREKAAGIVVGNLFSLRATEPDALRDAADPIGPLNGEALSRLANEAALDAMPVVCAWGGWNPGLTLPARVLAIAIFRSHGSRLVCLSRTASGAPRHPLYVPSRQPLEAFQ